MLFSKRINLFKNNENSSILPRKVGRIALFDKKNNDNTSIQTLKGGRIALFEEKIEEKNPILTNESKSMIIN